MVNVVWLQKWTQTIAPCYKTARPSHLPAERGDIYQAEPDDRTASAHNETKQEARRASSHPSNLGSVSMV